MLCKIASRKELGNLSDNIIIRILYYYYYYLKLHLQCISMDVHVKIIKSKTFLKKNVTTLITDSEDLLNVTSRSVIYVLRLILQGFSKGNCPFGNLA